MFGNLGQLTNLLRNAGQIQQKMREMQERLRESRFAGESGGGLVRATVDGRCELVSLKIDPRALDQHDVEMLEDLIVAAVRDANARCKEAIQKELAEATGGLDLGGMLG